MNRTKNTRAFSLIEMMAGLLIGGAALYGGLKAFAYFQKQNTRVAAKATAGTQVSTIGNFLKNRFEGSKNFQKLAIRFPAVSGSFSSARTSVGPGYAVYLDTGYDNSRIPSSCNGKIDNINVVVAQPVAQAIKITTPPGGGSTLKIGPVSGTSTVANLFNPGELIVLSTVTASEAIFVPVSLPLPTLPTEFLTDLAINAYSGSSLINGTAAGAKFINNYVAGDYVYRAAAYQLGVDVPDGSECVGKLKYGLRPFIYNPALTSAPQVVAEAITSFKVTPVLEATLTDCPALMPGTGGEVDLTNRSAVWQAINSDATGKCYQALKAIKISYSFKAFTNTERGVASQAAGSESKTEEVTGEYVFQSNK